jgi:hypothetical protein
MRALPCFIFVKAAGFLDDCKKEFNEGEWMNE